MEAVESTQFVDKLLSLVIQVKGLCGFIFSGRNPIILDDAHIIQNMCELRGFFSDDLKEYTSRRLSQAHHRIEIDDGTYATIHSLTDGHPILCALTVDWIVENPSQLEYITHLKKSTFEREIVLWLKAINHDDYTILQLMSVIDMRMDIRLAASISGIPTKRCEGVISSIRRFSFVKYFPGEQYVRLHDEMRRLFLQYLPLSEDAVQRAYIGALTYYAGIRTSEHNLDKSAGLLIEQLHYMLRHNVSQALCHFDTVFSYSLESYDYSLCSSLLDELAKFTDDTRTVQLGMICKAELANALYKPLEAMEIIGECESRIDPTADTANMARVLEVRGNCIINPCTLVGATPFEAIDFFQRSRDMYMKVDARERTPYCLFALGKAYVCVGRHEDAEQAFNDAFVQAGTNTRLAASVLEQKSQMLRLMQKVDECFAPLEQSYEMRKADGTPGHDGIYYYFLANAYRDKDDFEKADTYYTMAQAILTDVDDRCIRAVDQR